MTADDETSFWRSLPRIMESFTESGSRFADGRTFGLDDIRADDRWRAAAANAFAVADVEDCCADTVATLAVSVVDTERRQGEFSASASWVSA